jgi:type II secretory pathway pseudopilin PulG
VIDMKSATNNARRPLLHKFSSEEVQRFATRQKREGGFVLLFVFAFAAAIAVLLYTQLPRVAFEAQRDREDMLIERGEEYKRAIQLYVRKNQRYPQSIDDLENNNGVRFLRRRYKDPLTGEDEWRIIRINAAGQLEDSLVQVKRKPGETIPAQGQTDDESDVAENTALARTRESEANQGALPFSRRTGGGGAKGDNASLSPRDDDYLTEDGFVPLVDSSGNIIRPQENEGEESAEVAENNAASAASLPGGSAAAGNQPQGLPSNASPGQATPATSQRATNIIGQLLTTPRPGGLTGVTSGRAQQQTQGGLGAGIAGVASTLRMRGIKVYNDQESIHKWEFVYDARQETSQQGPASGAVSGSPGSPGQGNTRGTGGPSIQGGRGQGRSGIGTPRSGP